MSTNEPFNTARPEPLDSDHVSQPNDTTSPNSPSDPTSASSNSSKPAETSSVAYSESESLAWDKAFANEDRNTQPSSDLGDLTFDDDKPLHAAHHDSDEYSTKEAHTHLALPHTDSDQPLESGATFASAYAATGVTELPEEEPSSKTPPAELPVRTSAFEGVTPPTMSSPALSSSAPSESSSNSWAADPGTPNLTDLPDAPKGRVGAHIGSIFATLVLIPIAWYLISDSGVRLNLVQDNPWDTGSPHVAVILEFAGAMVSVFLLWLMARASSLGAQLWGLVLTIAGLIPIFAPKLGVKVVDLLDNTIGGYNAFTGNIVHHLALDLGSGRMALFGFIIFLTGVMIHLSRKSAARRSEATTLRTHVLGE